MGQEIDHSEFTGREFQEFASSLSRETALLESWFEGRRLSAAPSIAGFELESWLVGEGGRPAPVNRALLEGLQDPLVVPELARFNVELNAPPLPLAGDALARMRSELAALWQRCDAAAGALGARLMMIGILPAVRQDDLGDENMSDMVRYRALNEQLLRMRGNRPFQLDITGRETLRSGPHDVMMEAAATSFQLHLQLRPERAAAFFRAAQRLSGPMVAATANSPYLFGRDLWCETRIPLFEQAVAVGGDLDGADPAYRRVTFGSGYPRDSLMEIFRENLLRYPPLLPNCTGDAPERLSHVRLHNGTIWRWNRPLIGFDAGGRPHVRLEHRVVAAGPTVADLIANAAFFYGAVHALAGASPELPFAEARENFYAAARYGLDAELRWNATVSARALILEHLLPLARQGLQGLDIDPADIELYLGIVRARVASGRTGAQWQRDFVARHGAGMPALTEAYLRLQRAGAPVHEWRGDA